MKTPEWEKMCQLELAFFGRMSASISHELKNKLAIVKEESGLVLDIFSMADRGRPLDVEKVRGLVQKISDRMDVMDEITKRLNQFAHIVDVPYRTFDLSDHLALAVGLCQRSASMKKVQLEMSKAPSQVQINSNPFLLLHVLCLLLDRAMTAAGEEGRVSVAVEDAGDSARFVVSGSFDSSLLPDGNDREPLDGRLRLLGAAVSELADPWTVVLSVPKDLKDI